MLCQECQEREATVHMTRIVNGEKTERYLCENCARSKEGWSFLTEPVSLHSFLSGLLANVEKQAQPKRGFVPVPKCGECGLSFNEFKEAGRFGCGTCYETYEEQLEPLLQRIHGRGLHVGKVPLRSGGLILKRKKINDLRQEMQEAVRSEQFEEAASLRDKIRSLEEELEGDLDGE